MFWIDTFTSPSTFLCHNFSFESIPSPHKIHSTAFLQQHLVGEVKVLIQTFCFIVYYMKVRWKSRQVFHLERAGGQCFTNISCYSIYSFLSNLLCFLGLFWLFVFTLYIFEWMYVNACLLTLPTSQLNFILMLVTSRPFLKTAGGIVLGSVAVSAVSADVLPYISVAIKASFLKLGMCNICKNNIAKMFLDFLKILNCSFDRRFLNFW